MNDLLFSNKTYPVSFFWAFKQPLNALFSYVTTVLLLIPIFLIVAHQIADLEFLKAIILLFLILIPALIFLMLIMFIHQLLLRKNFSYVIDEDFIILKQGIVNKSQKNLPYGAIQDLMIKRDIFDRVFNIASLIIKNATSFGGLDMDFSGSSDYLTIGFSSNTAVIPGLSMNNALKLKEVILNKIKTKSFNDYGGLS